MTDFGTFHFVADSNRCADKPIFIKRKFNENHMTKYYTCYVIWIFLKHQPLKIYSAKLFLWLERGSIRHIWKKTSLWSQMASSNIKLFRNKLSKPTDENIKCNKYYLSSFSKTKKETITHISLNLIKTTLKKVISIKISNRQKTNISQTTNIFQKILKQ